ncbi:MAG: hypothetical protein K2N64_06370 [Anaeroplasmataceae bacterium]|nr:hypothetical protein [Anaeroplasmataceae bacterium]
MKNKLSKTKKEDREFQHNKIITLNRFFMRNMGVQTFLLLLVYTLSIVCLLVLINTTNIDDSLKISLISMIATFILTTSKSIIDKIIVIMKFLISLLGEEQRGLNKNIGVEVDKIDFENSDSHDTSS